MSNSSTQLFNSTTWPVRGVPNLLNNQPAINCLGSDPWDAQALGSENAMDPDLDLALDFNPEPIVDVESAGPIGDGQFPSVASSAPPQNDSEERSSAPLLSSGHHRLLM